MAHGFRQTMVGVVLLCISLPALASDYSEAREWLERMTDAMRDLSYQGTFVYLRGQHVETMRITHVKDAEDIRERMVAMSGPYREIIRDQDGVMGLLDDEKAISENSPLAQSMFPDIPIDALEQARNGYQFKVGQIARIAGHQGRRITIIPRDKFRYGYDLWLEEGTGLLLRWVLYDSDRRPLARLMFTDLSIGGEVDLSELESTTPREDLVRLSSNDPEEDVTAEPQASMTPEALPAGFKLAASNIAAQEGDATFEHLVYSDGLASVSVYIEFREQAKDLREGLSRMGIAYAYSKKAGKRQVTAIGEVPAVTVQAFGNAFVKPMVSKD
jgi:sigma-E factor negative regulatory protein RseB